MYAWALLALACGDPSLGGSDEVDSGSVDAARTPDAAPPVDTAQAVDAAPCEGGVASIRDEASGHCYIYFDTAVTWNTAVNECRNISAHVATSTSSEEDQLLARLVPDPVAVRDVWMGASDLAIEDTFVWITLEAMDYDNWRENEPNNGNGNGEEDCMILEVDMGATWDDRPCTSLFTYFCERSS